MSRLKSKLVKKIVTAAALVASACADAGTPVSMTTADYAVAPGQTIAALRRGETVPSDVSAQKVIGPGGGSLSVAGMTLHVPRGALTAPVAITATVPAGDVAVIHFQPHGLTFARAATLTLSAPNAGQSDALVYFDGSIANGRVVALEVIPAASSRGIASARISHFSGYTFAEGRSVE